MPHDFRTTVTGQHDLGHGNFLIEFDASPIDSMEAAQFFMVGIPGAETLLRRPYSVCGLPGTFGDRELGGPNQAQADAARYSILYKVVGKGTGLLSNLGPGATLELLGPLGHGFQPPAANRRPVFVAGGIGSAPFPAWARALDSRPITMFYGARNAGDLPLADWFARHCQRLVLSTDDGSVGHPGRVTEPLEQYLRSSEGADAHLYVCGPDPMLQAVAAIAARHGLPCDLAMEAHMACGFGVCLGCVVPTHAADGTVEYRRLCVDGPVMAAGTIAW